MTTSIRTTAFAITVAAAFPAFSNAAAPQLPTVIVTASGIPTADADATYASEVHDRKAIEASSATTLYDYLAQYTSLNVLPGFGNKLTPLIDLRGYGSEAGYQNVVLVIDGQRMNKIDMTVAPIGSLPLDMIDNIEISKGSGSVRYGDGAMGGVINITTRARTGVAASYMAGNYGAQAGTVSVGLSKELFDISFNASNNRFGGTGDQDPTGNRDRSESRTEQGRLTVRPVAGLSLFAQGTNQWTDVRYPNPITLNQFNSNPSTYKAPSFGANQYNHQTMESRSWKLGGEYQINKALSLAYTHSGEDLTSRFPTFRADFNTSADDFSFKYRSKAFDLITGLQRYESVRYGTSNRTSKDNLAAYVQSAFRIGQLSLTGGARTEEIQYTYVPNSGITLQRKHDLSAWDFGANYRLSNEISAFANVNHGFQAPDIDRFFNFGGTFNGFITPAKANNYTAGFNHDTPRNKLRAAVFYSKLKNEIYYDSINSRNTNLDKTHKYGLEANDQWQVRDDLQLRVAYTYIRAIIDSSSLGNGTYNGKDLPGVPKHTVSLGATWQPWVGGTINLNHVWRDSAYSTGDFANNRQQRQQSYQITNLSVRQRFGKVESFVAVDNLLRHKNGIWTDDDSIYAIDYQRLIRIGIKAEM